MSTEALILQYGILYGMTNGVADFCPFTHYLDTGNSMEVADRRSCVDSVATNFDPMRPVWIVNCSGFQPDGTFIGRDIDDDERKCICVDTMEFHQIQGFKRAWMGGELDQFDTYYRDLCHLTTGLMRDICNHERMLK